MISYKSKVIEAVENYLRIIYFLFSAFIFSSCNNFEEVKISKVEDLKILNFSQKGIQVGIGITIKNPNAIGFSIYSSSFNIKLNDIFIGTASIKDKVKIKAHSEEVNTFTFESDLSKLNILALPQILGIVQDKSATVSLDGELKVGNFFHKRKIPVDFQQKISLN